MLGLLAALSLAACGSPENTNTSGNANGAVATVDNGGTYVEPPAAEPTVPKRYALDEAARRGLVEYQVTGRGGSSGAALTLKIQRLAADPIEVYVAPGTVFNTGSKGVQSMVARSIVKEIAEAAAEQIAEAALEESGVVELVDDAVHNFLVEAYCRDFELANPSAQDSFTVASVDKRSAALFQAARERGLDVTATQAAIWMDRGVTPAAIAEKFDATAADFEAASALLAQLPART
ncbi:MAG TPA: hypothetical protein VFZ91_16095 [Allosphingosinicella sp.]